MAFGSMQMSGGAILPNFDSSEKIHQQLCVHAGSVGLPGSTSELAGGPSGGRLVEDASGHLVWQPVPVPVPAKPAPASAPAQLPQSHAQPQGTVTQALPGLLMLHQPQLMSSAPMRLQVGGRVEVTLRGMFYTWRMVTIAKHELKNLQALVEAS